MAAERRHKLTKKAERGKRAEYIIEFADETLADAEDWALARLRDRTVELESVAAQYNAAVALWQKVNMAAAQGREANRKLEELKER